MEHVFWAFAYLLGSVFALCMTIVLLLALVGMLAEIKRELGRRK